MMGINFFYHIEGFSLLKCLKGKYCKKTAKTYKAKYREYGIKQISLSYRFGLFFKRKRFWSKPHLAFGVVVLKGLEYLVARFGYIVGGVKNG